MKKRTVEECKALFAEQLTSGLSARQFCMQQDMCSKYFSLRQRRLSAIAPVAFVQLRRQSSVATLDMPAMALVRHGPLELRQAPNQPHVGHSMATIVLICSTRCAFGRSVNTRRRQA